MKPEEKAKLLRQYLTREVFHVLHHAQIVYGMFIDVNSKAEVPEAKARDAERELAQVQAAISHGASLGLIPVQVTDPAIRRELYISLSESLAKMLLKQAKYYRKHPSVSVPEGIEL